MPALFYMLHLLLTFVLLQSSTKFHMALFVDDSSARASHANKKIIREYFELHPEVKDDARFLGLFTGRSRGQKRSFNEGPSDENDQNAPPTTRPHLEITPFHSVTTPSHAGLSLTPRNVLATSSSESHDALVHIPTVTCCHILLIRPGTHLIFHLTRI
ncbi:hypothetical protein AZE42_08543 [Rhizopogon vesiculosus]|uniref:Uncharacterized protein n=1 Tax=Rhizopogon vesiculosus TaxID=180088 RepID=A0A1J8PNK9_9AGAM|nr:hypothetical protein AZE42_08543 [Rhizopogon vesiculosus]